jgi:hypothetical protein
MTDVEHEYLVENGKLRAELERLRGIAARALTLAKESQDAAKGRHEAWLDSALQSLDVTLR